MELGVSWVVVVFFEEPETEQLKAGFQTGFPHCSVTKGSPQAAGMDE